MGDVRPRLADVPVHLSHDTDVLVAVEQRILLFALDAHMTGTGVRGLVRLETGVRQDDNQALRVLIRRRDGDVLLGDELRQLGGWEGLGS